MGLPLDVLGAIRWKRGRVEGDGARRRYRQPTRGWVPKPTPRRNKQSSAEKEAREAAQGGDAGAAPSRRPNTRLNARLRHQASTADPNLRPEHSSSSHPTVASADVDSLEAHVGEGGQFTGAACPSAASLLRELRRLSDPSDGEGGAVRLATAFRNRNRRMAAQVTPRPRAILRTLPTLPIDIWGSCFLLD